ncbi:MAG: hypothetical protein RSD62_06410 [Ruthenibacterium sp.]
MYAVGTRRFWSELMRLFLAVFLTVSFLMRPTVAADGILRGLALCYRSVIPALFPFFILSKIILTSPFAGALGLPLLPYTRFVLRVRDKRAATALLLGLTGGFGGGASCLQSLYQSGILSRSEVQRMLWCSINAGPAFVVACVGSGMLGSARSGWLLYAALCIGSFCCGAAGSFFDRDNTAKVIDKNIDQAACANAKKEPAIRHNFEAQKNSQSFSESVREAVFSTLTLCGFVLFFSFLLAVAMPPSASDLSRFLLCTLLEVTSACSTATAGSMLFPIFFCCAALSIMGSSVWAQVRALLDSDISLSALLASRLMHLPISLGALRLLLYIFPLPLKAGATAVLRMQMPMDACCAVFLLCCAFFCITTKDSGLRFSQKRV